MEKHTQLLRSIIFVISFVLIITNGASGVTLSQLHGGCNAAYKSRHPDCVSAMHRFCMQSSPWYSIGVSREVGSNAIGMSCLYASWYGEVSVNTLRYYHGRCTLTSSQQKYCLSAVHRYCQLRFGSHYAGTAQEVGNGFFEVGCFYATIVQDLSWGVLTSQHGSCTFPGSDTAACYSAISRWCQSQGSSGGISQEVNSAIVKVACYSAYYVGDVSF